MAFKLIVLCATLAYASAGVAPVVSTYSAAPLAYSAGPLAYSAAAPTISYHGASAYGAPAYAAPLSYQAPALTSQSSNIYRSFGNLGQISTYSKTIDTPFSSVSKSDVRVSNPGLRIAAAPAFAASPVIAARAYAAPALAAPVVAAHSPLIGVAYSAAPAVSHMNYVSAYANYHF